MVLVVDLCAEGVCTEDAAVYVQPLYASLKAYRPKLCAAHAADFRTRALAQNMLEGKDYELVPLCSLPDK